MLSRTTYCPSQKVESLLVAARRDFETCLEYGRDAASSLHQLGVLDFLMGQHEKAFLKFRQSIAKREEAHEKRGTSPRTKRLAYSYRRLAICYVLARKDEETAQQYFALARDIADELGHLRLLAEIEADVEALGLKLPHRGSAIRRASSVRGQMR